MSLWFDKKNQEYAFDGISGWLKHYIEKLTGTLSADLDAETLTRATAHNAHLADEANPHNVTKAQLGLGNVDNTADCNKPLSSAMQTALNYKVDGPNPRGGFAVGQYAEAENGVAVGKSAISSDDATVVGIQAMSYDGVAIGKRAFCNGGVAIGENSVAGNGFSGGKNAKTATEDGAVVDAIQLGEGTNENENTLQVYDYQLLDADGQIPPERFMGTSNTISGDGAIALMGIENDAYADNSAIIGGWSNSTEEEQSFVGGGVGNAARGVNSAIIGGNANTIYGDNGLVAAGNCLIANGYAATFGHYNTYSYSMIGSDSGTTGNALLIGNGTAQYRGNAFRVDYDGSVYGTGAFHTSGADLAHVFEWSDGNEDGEDRRGYFVTFEDGKVRIANSSDEKILGVVSDNASFVANDYSENWHGMYLKDVYGGYVTEDETVTETDPETGEETSRTIKNRVLNPDYDPSRPYVSRANRPEYAVVGHDGILIVNDDGTCVADGYCTVTDSGTATKSAEKTPYYVIKRLDSEHIQIFI